MSPLLLDLQIVNQSIMAAGGDGKKNTYFTVSRIKERWDTHIDIERQTDKDERDGVGERHTERIQTHTQLSRTYSSHLFLPLFPNF